MSNDAGPIRTRRIYYISGFDPRGARYYHRLYRDEAVRQAATAGFEVQVGARGVGAGRDAAWSVRADWPDGQSVRSDYRFLAWDDIIRRHWERSPWRVLANGLVGYRRYIGGGAFARLKRSHRGALFSGLFPIVFLALWAVLVACALAAGAAFGQLLAPGWVGATGTALVLGGGALWLGRVLGDRLGLFWLLRTYLFVEEWGAVGCPLLEERIDRFAAQIARDQEAAPVDEVLLVGHSVGAVIAAAVASRRVRRQGEGAVPLKLLTLGQCVPLLAFIPQAEAFRREVADLVVDGRVAWFDVTAKVDPLCFHAVNPAVVCDAPATAPGMTIMHNARFFRMFRPQTYRRLRRDKLRLHFQYLMSAELETGYDYFRITAGPRPLGLALEP